MAINYNIPANFNTPQLIYDDTNMDISISAPVLRASARGIGPTVVAGSNVSIGINTATASTVFDIPVLHIDRTIFAPYTTASARSYHVLINGGVTNVIPLMTASFKIYNPSLADVELTVIARDITKTFSATNKRTWVYQPNYVRRRNRYRGPRESIKINQEASGMFFDLKAIAKHQNINNQSLIDNVNNIVNGVEYDDVTWDDENLSLDGITILSSRLEELRKRVKALEG